LTSYDLLSVRGFNPDGDDKNVRDRYDDALRWLADVVNLKTNPVGLVDSTATVEDDGIAIVTHEPRGWR
jgi:hypothetical protein